MLDSQSVRDLRWAVESPSLILDGMGNVRVPDVDPEELDRFLQSQKSSHRVGHYFESLIHFWLTKIRGVNMIRDRAQIFDGKRTIGELDFLFEDEDGCVTHLETAVKFYLHLPGNNADDASGRNFIGPNPADNFPSKMNRLFQHQLPLSELHFPDVQRREAFVKGRIFYHPSMKRPSELPEQMSPNHLQQTWLYRKEINWLHEQHAACKFRLLMKPHWLADDEASIEDEMLLSANQMVEKLSAELDQHNRPALVSVLKGLDGDRSDQCAEVDRVFVVNDSWPATF